GHSRAGIAAGSGGIRNQPFFVPAPIQITLSSLPVTVIVSTGPLSGCNQRGENLSTFTPNCPFGVS
ncbi:MAG TPA: hypothetical protein VEC12_05510, partial [Bacteroidia bacterium]|nr:hypothetical protein [Bacteroidia bacterium]